MKDRLRLLLVMSLSAVILAGCSASVVNDETGKDVTVELENDKEKGVEISVKSEDSAEAEDSREAGENADSDESAKDTEDAGENETGGGDSYTARQYEDPHSLPPYKYTGDDPVEGAVIDYMMSDESEMKPPVDRSDLIIPFVMIADKNESDPEDILVFAYYGIEGFKLYNTNLLSVTGSWGEGIFHLKKSGDAYSVESAELPLVYEDVQEIFGPYKEEYEKLSAFTDDERDEAADRAASDYINENHLYITERQSYGWPIKEISNTPGTPADAQFYTYQSPLGYSLTFDMRKLCLSEDMDSDSYGEVNSGTYTGTLMIIKKSKAKDAEDAIKEEAKSSESEASDISSASIGDGIECKRGVWNVELEDGRIFRYICYAVPCDDGIMDVIIETTYEKGVSEMSTQDLDDYFAGTLASFKL